MSIVTIEGKQYIIQDGVAIPISPAPLSPSSSTSPRLDRSSSQKQILSTAGVMVSDDMSQVITHDATGNMAIKGNLQVTGNIQSHFERATAGKYETDAMESEVRKLELQQRMKKLEGLEREEELKRVRDQEKEKHAIEMKKLEFEQKKKRDEEEMAMRRAQGEHALRTQLAKIDGDISANETMLKEIEMKIQLNHANKSNLKCFNCCLWCMLPPLSWCFCQDCFKNKISGLQAENAGLRQQRMHVVSQLEAAKTHLRRVSAGSPRAAVTIAVEGQTY
jgi:hypothetical protein